MSNIIVCLLRIVGTHYKTVYNGEERYAFTLSKIAGDYRSNTNTLKDAINMLFGR